MNIESSTRVALLSHGHNNHRKVQQLVEDIANETLVLSSECVNESLSQRVANCDMIVIEACHYLTPTQRQAINWIRTSSLAPIVVLIGEKYTEDTTIRIIESGADAVISLSAASDVILARCQALMRRWQGRRPTATKLA